MNELVVAQQVIERPPMMTVEGLCESPPADCSYARRTRLSLISFMLGAAGLLTPFLAYNDMWLAFLSVLATAPLFVFSASTGLPIARARPLILFWVLPATCMSLFGVVYWGGAIVGLFIILGG